MTSTQDAAADEDWGRKLGRYRTPSAWRGAFELAITAIPFVLCWYAMYWSLQQGYLWIYLGLLLPTVGFVVRLFLIQHDCGHQAFVANRFVNDGIGRLISVLTLTPYDH